MSRIELSLPNRGGAKTPILITCHSWVHQDQMSRIFFSSEARVPRLTPPALLSLRKEELDTLKVRLLCVGSEPKHTGTLTCAHARLYAHVRARTRAHTHTHVVCVQAAIHKGKHYGLVFYLIYLPCFPSLSHIPASLSFLHRKWDRLSQFTLISNAKSVLMVVGRDFL